MNAAVSRESVILFFKQIIENGGKTVDYGLSQDQVLDQGVSWLSRHWKKGLNNNSGNNRFRHYLIKCKGDAGEIYSHYCEAMKKYGSRYTEVFRHL